MIDFADEGLQDGDIQKLVDVCQQATFGRGDQDVFDESYRKAWKLDTSEFATQFDIIRSGVMNIIHDQLLHDEKNNMKLEPHLYKLNIYGTFTVDLILDTRVEVPRITRTWFVLQTPRRYAPEPGPLRYTRGRAPHGPYWGKFADWKGGIVAELRFFQALVRPWESVAPVRLCGILQRHRARGTPGREWISDHPHLQPSHR